MKMKQTTDAASLAATLIRLANSVLGEFPLADEGLSAGSVGAALKTRDGHFFTGICLDFACGIGFCAEHAAVAEMLKARETEIEMIVAVAEGVILPPCGRCRELLVQVNRHNLDTQVILPGGRIRPLRELLPEHWMADEVWQQKG